MRLTPIRVLAVAAFLAASTPAELACEVPPDAPQYCLARPGWWVSAGGTRLFRVNDTGTQVLAGTLPATPCGSVKLPTLGISGPPCAARAEVDCSSQVEIFFLTFSTALVSVRLVTTGASACSDTCLAWDAVPAHADTTVAVTPTEWSRLKAVYR